MESSDEVTTTAVARAGDGDVEGAGQVRPRDVRRYVLHVLAVPLLVLAIHLALSWSYYAGPQSETADLAVAALQVHRAAHFQELLGPYSRFQFNHPGPISFYYYAFTEPLFAFVPTPMGRHLLAQLFLNFAFLITALHVVYLLGRRRGESLLLAAAFFLVFARSDLGHDALANIWSPFLVLFPMLALLATASAVAVGRFGFVLPATVAAAFIGQNHVSGLIVSCPILFAGLASGWWQRRRRPLSRAERNLVVAAAAFLLVTSLPILVEEFAFPDGNLTKIWTYVRTSGGEQHPWRISAHFLAGFFRTPLAFLHVNGELWECLILVVLIASWRFHGRLERALAVAFAGSLFFSTLAATRVADAMMRYIFLYEVAVIAVGLFLVLVAARAYRFGIPWLAAGLGAVAMLATTTITQPILYDQAPIAAMMRFVSPKPGAWYEIYWKAGSPHHPQWGVAAALAVALTREGAHACVPEEWRFMFGRAMSPCPSGPPVVRVALYGTSAHKDQVRERMAVFGDSTVEMGEMLQRELPIKLSAEGSDELFSGWTNIIDHRRGLWERKAEVRFTLGQAPGGAAGGLLTVTVRGKSGTRVRVSLNDAELGFIAPAAKDAPVSLPFPLTLLRAHATNTVAFSTGSERIRPDRRLTFEMTELSLVAQ